MVRTVSRPPFFRQRRPEYGGLSNPSGTRLHSHASTPNSRRPGSAISSARRESSSVVGACRLSSVGPSIGVGEFSISFPDERALESHHEIWVSRRWDESGSPAFTTSNQCPMPMHACGGVGQAEQKSSTSPHLANADRSEIDLSAPRRATSRNEPTSADPSPLLSRTGNRPPVQGRRSQTHG